MTPDLAAILDADTRTENALMNTRKRLREANETIARLTKENASLRKIVCHQARILDRSEPARVSYAKVQGEAQ